MAQIIAQLRASGETITDDEVARVSPMAFTHVIPNGTYFIRGTSRPNHQNYNEHGSLLDMGRESEM